MTANFYRPQRSIGSLDKLYKRTTIKNTATSLGDYLLLYSQLKLIIPLGFQMKRDDLLNFGRYVVPICVREHGSLKHVGTGFLVNSGENDYLVSAAHIFRQCIEKELLFLIGNKVGRLIQGGPMKYSKKTHGDIYDIGVFALLGNPPPYTAVGKEAISIDKLLPQYHLKLSKEFALVGFPASKSFDDKREKKTSVKLYGYSANSVGEEQYKKVGIDSRYHIALKFNRKKCVNDQGIKMSFPKPYGMSGSPIVLFSKIKEIDLHQKAFIVGIATTYVEREKLIYGTDIILAADLMRQLDSEIRGNNQEKATSGQLLKSSSLKETEVK